ncbi:hypothetical protein Tco_1269608 [Tanacetum coccineum]
MRSSFTTTNVEFVCSIKSETFVEDGNLKEIDYDLFLYDSESCEFNQLLCIDLDIFSYEIVIQESYEEIVYKITNVENEKYSAPQEKREHWCRAILQEKENERQYWASCNPSSNICDGGDLPINIEKHYWESNNDTKREGVRMIGLLEDPEECGEDKANTILGVIHDKLNNDWFNNTSKDEDDLEGILDYLKPRSYDGFIDLDDEAYNKRRCRLLGMTYEEPTPILIEKAKVTRYTVGPGNTYTKVKLVQVDAHRVVRLYLATGKHFKSGLVGYHADDDDGLELWMLLMEADLEHGLEHVVSSSSRAMLRGVFRSNSTLIFDFSFL